MNLPFPKPPTDKEELDGWFKLLTPEQLEAAKTYYYDQWNWESGTDDDRAMYDDLVTEIAKRKGLEMFMREITKLLDSHIDDDIIEKLIFDSDKSPYIRGKDED